MKKLIVAAFLLTLTIISASISEADVGPFKDAQVQIIKAAVLAEPSLQTAIQTADDQAVANWLNEADPSATKAWKSQMSIGELFDALNWTAYIGRSAAEKSALQFMFTTGVINPSRTNVRQGITDIFSGGTQVATDQRAAFVTAAQRTMNRIESICATGPVSGAYTMTFEGAISPQDVSNITR